MRGAAREGGPYRDRSLAGVRHIDPAELARPEACGLRPDGDSAAPLAESRFHPDDLSGHAWTAAVETPAFWIWIFAIGAALYGLVASGYAVAPDGRFLLNIATDDAVTSPITVVLLVRR